MNDATPPDAIPLPELTVRLAWLCARLLLVVWLAHEGRFFVYQGF